LGRLTEREDAFVPERVLELKLVSSLWTVRDVLFKGKPKIVNLMQAGHYAWKVGVPAELWYTSRTNFALTDYSENRWFASKNFPRQGKPLSEYCKYNEKGQLLSVEPFIVGYEIEWTPKGQLRYRVLGGDAGEGKAWTHTFITQAGIEQFYESVSAMGKINVLLPRPVNKDADGEKAGFDLCEAQYCPLSATCKKHESSNVAAWKKDVDELLNSK